MLKRISAECFGTFTLVLMAAAPSAIGGFDPSSEIGRLTISLSTGFAIAAMVYMVGNISGAHINPAITIGYFAAGRFHAKALVSQFCAQVAGAVLAAAVIALIAAGAPDGVDTHHLGATGWLFTGQAPAYPWWAAFLAEFLATFAFVTTFLTIRHEKSPTQVDGLAIGLTAAGLLFAISRVSGGSVNPARSLGPALFAGDGALMQLWLYIVAPALGAVLAGLFSGVMPLYDRTSHGSHESAVAEKQQNADG